MPSGTLVTFADHPAQQDKMTDPGFWAVGFCVKFLLETSRHNLRPHPFGGEPSHVHWTVRRITFAFDLRCYMIPVRIGRLRQ